MPTTFEHSTLPVSELHEDKRIKQPVRAASTANVTLTAPGATLDGVTLASGDRILLKDQTTASQNGIYVWTGSGAALTRATDASAASDFVYGFKMYVREGTANGGSYWTYTQSAAVTLGTTSLTFTKDGVGSGSVTSVALTMPTGFSVSGSPVTGSGTLAVTEGTQSANRVKAGPASGAAAAPGYRALVPGDLPTMVASGASHAGGAVPDPGSTAGTTKFLREDGTWAVPAGGGGGSGGSGTPASNSLGSNVSITANTFADGPSLSLAPGTWFLVGTITVQTGSSTGVDVTAKLWDGTTVVDSANQMVNPATQRVELTVAGFVSPSSTTTYKVSATLNGSAAGTILAAAGANSAGNNASTLVAIPVFGYSQSASAAAVASSGTITTSGVTAARVSPTGAVTGVILQAGTYAGQPVCVVNEAVAANTITFAASGTSNVADGTSDVISGLTAREFVWNTGTSLWYPCK